MAPNEQPSREERAASPSKRKRMASVETVTQNSSTNTTTRPPTKKPRLASDLSIKTPDESKVIESVDAKYNVQIHSVISSSKIQKKVSSVLSHLASAPAGEASFESRKHNISVLRAKASDAGKLVSIAEIAKREIESQQDGSSGNSACWFQYIGIGQSIKETPREKTTVVEETILGGDDQKNGQEEERADKNASDQDDDFEYMKTPFERAIEGKPKKQAVAIMNLFLARVSIDELKRRYGEDTNEKVPARKT